VLPIVELETPLAISVCLPSRRLDVLRDGTVQFMRATIHRFLPSVPLSEATV
jgi:hypothetical protein